MTSNYKKQNMFPGVQQQPIRLVSPDLTNNLQQLKKPPVMGFGQQFGQQTSQIKPPPIQQPIQQMPKLQPIKVPQQTILPPKPKLPQQLPPQPLVIPVPQQIHQQLPPPAPIQQQIITPQIQQQQILEEESQKIDEIINENTEKEKIIEQNFTDMLHNSIEGELIDHGYVPQVRYVINENGKNSVKYVKATDRNGNIVFVIPDTESVSFGIDETVYLNNSGVMNAFPYEMILSSTECMKFETCGLVFVCDGGICTLRRDGATIDPIQEVYNINDKVIDIEDSKYGYPIVKMSEIMNNPADIAANVATLVTRLRKTSYDECDKILKDMSENISKLSEAFNNYAAKQKYYKGEIDKTTAKFKELNAEYNNPKVEKTAENISRHNTILNNLAIRDDFRHKLIKNNYMLKVTSDYLAQVTADLDKNIIFMEKTFRDVSSVIK